MKKLIVTEIILAICAFALGGTWAKANISYGSGYYTNLCGGGTSADSYQCNSGCIPTSGLCRSSTGGAARYICSGKWTGCLESENWGNVAQLGQVSCGKTVQLSLYDKKCRQEDGTWDPECKLLGYMVWYSGDCWGTSTAPTLATPTPTRKTTPTITPRISPVVTITTMPTETPTRVPTPGVICNRSCVMDSECGAGFGCEAGYCRNPACTTDTTCFCTTLTATDSGKGKGSPETGLSAWWGTTLMILMAVGGWQMIKISHKLWE